MVILYLATTVEVPRLIENSMSFLDLFFLIVKSLELKLVTSSLTPSPSPTASMLKGIASTPLLLFIRFWRPTSLYAKLIFFLASCWFLKGSFELTFYAVLFSVSL
jgi:hypothetical protein